MRKLFFLFLALVATTSLWAYDFRIDGICYKILKGDEVEVTFQEAYSYDNYLDLVTAHIPSTIEYSGVTYRITSINSKAFKGCRTLTSITIPEHIKSIGERAFSECTSLTSVIWNAKKCADFNDNWDYPFRDVNSQITSFIFGDSVEHIPAFLCCLMNNLTSITLPNSVTSIGHSVFWGCSSLSCITIPENVTILGSSFAHCNSLTTIQWNAKNCADFTYSPFSEIGSRNVSITFGDSVKYIPANLCYQMDALTSITIPTNVTSIAYNAFGNYVDSVTITADSVEDFCKSRIGYSLPSYHICRVVIAEKEMTDLIIPNSIDSIHDYAFYSMPFTSVTIPENITSIGHAAFRGCRFLTSVNIPNSLKTIENSAFYDCVSLDTVVIPKSVTTIEDYAFQGCTLARENFINNSSLDAGANSYWGAEIVDMEIDGLLIRNNTVIGCRPNITSVTIPKIITSIGNEAFAGCTNLVSITIPNSITSIGHSAFSGCSSLKSISIPNSVVSMGGATFENCTALQSVVLSENITAIPSFSYRVPFNITGCFDGCTSLTSISIPDNITTIEGRAFDGCSSLTSIIIPKSVTTIEDYAFQGCTFAKENFINNSSLNAELNNYWGATVWAGEEYDGVFIKDSVVVSYRKSLQSVTIPSFVTNIHDDAFINNSTRPASLTSVVWNAANCADFNHTPFSFYGNYNLTSFTFGDSVRHIPASLCSALEGLTSIYIPNNVVSIGDYAFGHCENLTSVTIPKNVMRIGKNPFADCSSLTSIIVDSENKQYDSRNNCYAIIETGTNNLISGCKNTIIPDGVIAIGEYALSGCRLLTNITIPESVTKIGEGAFSGCSSLIKTNYSGDIANWFNIQFANSGSNPIACSHNFYINDKEITNLVVPNTVDSIYSYTFLSCKSLTSLTIPRSVQNIGNLSFAGCSSLSSIVIDKRNKQYSSYSNCNAIIEKATNKLITGCKNTIIPYSVTRIGFYAFYDCQSLTSLNIPNTLNYIDNFAFTACSGLSSITIPKSMKTVLNCAFMGCASLTSLTIHSGETYFCNQAFDGCPSLDTIYCYTITPPALETLSNFSNYNATLYVPCEALLNYKTHSIWGNFSNIQCISSQETDRTEVIAETSTTSVTITWPTEEEADTYTIVIKKDGELVCTLTFNSEGQLLNIAFAPGRNGNHPAQYAEQVANNGYRFTVIGLEDGTDYTYDIVVKNEANQVIKTHSGKFTTEPYSAVDNTHSSSSATNTQKLLRNGQLIILRDGVEYNAMGQEL